ncbi:hypothetical protein C8J57DRAFT_1251323 [Mycena rebaudengoi]|nr:hypothetical protein C8J57DRAFT_1251323 [Mycena rebaudengoi]
MSVPRTDDDVNRQYLTVRSLGPPITSFQYSYLYATDSGLCHNVAMPVRHNPHGPMTLVIGFWVPRGVAHFAEHRRVRVSVGLGIILEHQFTIIFVPPSRRPGGPINRNSALCSAVTWYSNILVLKHGKHKAVVNMVDSEGKLVDNIVACYIALGLLH